MIDKSIFRVEADEQKDVFKHLDYLLPYFPAIHPLAFNTLNGAHLKNARKQMRSLKAQGLVPGVHDIIFLHGRGGYFYFTIEMKNQDGGTKSEAQEEFQASAAREGGYSNFAVGANEAKDLIDGYFEMPTTQSMILDAKMALERGDKDTALNILRGVTEKW